MPKNKLLISFIGTISLLLFGLVVLIPRDTIASGPRLSILDTDLQSGNTGTQVKTLQKYLSKENLYPEKAISGWFGPLTEEAVKKFQLKYGIDVNGKVGGKTREKLNQIYCGYKKPRSDAINKRTSGNWQIVDNKIQGYEIKFPTNWTMHTIENKTGGTTDIFRPEGAFPDYISIHAGKYSEYKSLPDAIAKNDKWWVDGEMGYRLNRKIFIIVNNDWDNIFRVMAVGDMSDEGFRDSFYAIVSTIRFN